MSEINPISSGSVGDSPAAEPVVPAMPSAPAVADTYVSTTAGAINPADVRPRRTTARYFTTFPLTPDQEKLLQRLQDADRPFVNAGRELDLRRLKSWHDLNDLLTLIGPENGGQGVRELLMKIRIPRPRDWNTSPDSPAHFLYRWIYEQREVGRDLLYEDTRTEGASTTLKQFIGTVWDTDDALHEQARSLAASICRVEALAAFYALESPEFRAHFESRASTEKKPFYLHPQILESEIYRYLKILLGLGIGIDFARITAQDIERALRVHILENRSLLPLRALVEGPFVRLAREWITENGKFNFSDNDKLQLVFTAAVDDYLQSRENFPALVAEGVAVDQERMAALLKECDVKPNIIDWLFIGQAVHAFALHYADKIKGEESDGNFETDKQAAVAELKRARKEFGLLNRHFIYRLNHPDQPLHEQHLEDRDIPFAIYADRRGRIHFYLAMQMTYRMHVPPATKVADILRNHPKVALTLRKTNSVYPAENIADAMNCLTFGIDAGDWVVWTATGEKAREVLKMIWYLNENHWPRAFADGEEIPFRRVAYTSVEALGSEVLALMKELQVETLSGVYSAQDNAFVIGPSGASHYQIAIAAGFDEPFLHGKMARVAFTLEGETLRVVFPQVTAFDEHRGRSIIEKNLRALFDGIAVERLEESSVPAAASPQTRAGPMGDGGVVAQGIVVPPSGSDFGGTKALLGGAIRMGNGTPQSEVPRIMAGAGIYLGTVALAEEPKPVQPKKPSKVHLTLWRGTANRVAPARSGRTAGFLRLVK